jgi:hypothetical protein
MQKLVAGHCLVDRFSKIGLVWYSKACLADAFGKIALQLAETQ